jgi:tRNA nucleotidyltransferase (CCA-adding enzyme)
MDGLSTKSKLHSRVSKFVAWIAPAPETREEIKKQADEVRDRISDKAREDGVVVTATPKAGSFAKKTGLRRHMRGGSEVEGQDIDVPFVVKPPKEGEYQLQPMIDKFLKYADSSYPRTEKEPTKSSVKLKFTSTLSYDLVPLFATSDPEKQILVRTTGEQIVTSVQKHTEFIKTRTHKSDEKRDVVLFNECVRLMKWWRMSRSQLEVR